MLACASSKLGKGDLLRFSAMRVVDGLKKWSRGAITLVSLGPKEHSVINIDGILSNPRNSDVQNSFPQTRRNDVMNANAYLRVLRGLM